MKQLLFFLCLLCLPCSAQDKRYHGDGIDNVLRFVPITAVITMKAAGMEGASSWKRLATNTVASYAIAAGTTYALKHSIHSRRPDGTDRRSFPSGHSTVVFAGAHILYKEYGRKYPWIAVAGYGVAAATAADRVRRNRHHWADVAAGAAIGIAGTELGYRLGDLITGEKSRYQLSITPNEVALNISL